MKKIFIMSLLSTCFYGALNAQQNSIPTTGDVGLGTTTPSAKLDVNGRVKIDSTLVVKDSVTIEKSMRVMEESSFEGDSKFNNVDIQGYLKVLGTSEFNNDILLPAVNTTTGIDGKSVLITRENGLVEKFNFEELSISMVDAVYQDRTCGEGTISNPTWANGPNKIYSPCPQVKVGVGTDTPTHGLHVTSNARFGQAKVDFTQAIGDEPNSYARLYIKNPNLGAGLHINNTGNSSQYSKLIFLEYDEATTEVLKVHNTDTDITTYLFEGNGKMTVNNGSQKIFQLNENGLLRLRKVRVDSETWADYVFDSNYTLMPLNEVEQFITHHKHLPNIPSESEILKDGVDLVEMNVLLLEKVEELMLHTIEQQKEIDQLKEEIGKLKNEQ